MLDTETLRRLVADSYGLSVEEFRLLPGEVDTNFAVSTAHQTFILKLSAQPAGLLDLQRAALESLTGPETPRIVRTLQGRSHIPYQERHAWLLEHLPGEVLARTRPHSPELLQSLGALLGRVDRQLQGFEHPALQRPGFKWDLSEALWIAEHLGRISDPADRAIVDKRCRAFRDSTLPHLRNLRRGPIHNDANDYNVLVTDGRVSGLIDFGDLTEAPIICEPAIACAYAMLDKPDPLSAAASVIRGFHREFPLTEAELEVLLPLIAMRLAVSVTNSAIERTANPGNGYLTISEGPALNLLRRLEGLHPRFALAAFRDACSMAPCPASPRILSWLRDNAGRLQPPIAADYTGTGSHVLDFDIASPELRFQDFADMRRLSDQIFRRLRIEGAAVGIGKYNEVRPLYTSPLFKVDGNDGPEWRTVHLGIDIFCEAGTPVVAPLDGRVHSFQNNAGELDYGPTLILEHAAGTDLKFFTLYGHLQARSLAGKNVGDAVRRGETIAWIGDDPENGGWPPHLHFQIVADLLDQAGEFAGVARPSQRSIWLSLCPDPNVILGIPDMRLATPAASTDSLLERRRSLIGPSLSVSYTRPLNIVRGYMQRLYDADGQAYLDAVNNVAHVGHCHPRVVEAGQRQMAVLNTNTRYLNELLVRYAERLTATLPSPLRVCYFVCSGSEANELALRLARTCTGRRETIVMEHGYHGNTSALVDVSSYKFDGPGGAGAPPHVRVIPLPRSADVELPWAEPGAFIAESILSCAGQVVLPGGFLRNTCARVRQAGGVFIADEVQTGFGRVGSHFWAFEAHGVVPDIVTMGKPIGNGHPLGAVVTTPEVARQFANGMEYFNTFGGNPVSCAIGLAVIDVVESEGLQAQALDVGNHLMNRFRSLHDDRIRDVRGSGLFIGVELESGRLAGRIADRMRDRGVLMSTDGPLHNVLKIKPPLVFNRDDADFLVSTFEFTLAEASGSNV